MNNTSPRIHLCLIIILLYSKKSLISDFGSPGASRTHNLFLRTESLYPLSYGAKTDIRRRVAHIEDPLFAKGKNLGDNVRQDPSEAVMCYNYNMNLFKKKDAMKTEQEKVEERREEVLATGRKFKYPLQWTKHRIVINTVLIAIIVLTIVILGIWLALYRFNMTDEMLFRITKIIPAPVASVDSENVRFSDYLMLYRSSILSIERQSGQLGDGGSVEDLRNRYRRAALDEAEEYVFAIKLAKENNITVTNEEIAKEFDRHLKIGGSDRSEASFIKIIEENFGLTKSEYERMLYLNLIKAKVEVAIDEKATTLAARVENLITENDGNYEKVAETLGSEIQYEETGGMVSTQNLDGGRASEAFRLEPGGQSGRFVSMNGDGYYFVKLISKNDTEVNFVSIKIPFTEFQTQFDTLRAEDKIQEFIEIKSEV